MSTYLTELLGELVRIYKVPRTVSDIWCAAYRVSCRRRHHHHQPDRGTRERIKMATLSLIKATWRMWNGCTNKMDFLMFRL